MKERIKFYDNLKFVLILLVVVGHLADCDTAQVKIFRSIYLFIYAFHMPLFFFAAGLFHRNKNVISKVLSYVMIGFLMKIILFMEKTMLNGKIAVFHLFEDADIPWYMFVLAIYLFVTYILRDINPRVLFFAVFVLACFAGYDNSIGDYLYFSRAIVFYPCYVLGVMLEPMTLVEETRKKYLKIASMIILGVWGCICLFCINDVYVLRGLFTGRNSFSSISSNELFIKYGFLYRLLCYGITFLTSGAIFCMVPEKEIPIITRCGGRSLQIYFWHWLIVLIIIRTGIGRELVSTRGGQIIWLLLGVLIVYFLSLEPFAFPTRNIMDVCKNKVKNE